MNQSTTPGGGAVAIRGFLVQALIALLDVASREPSFSEIMLEPKVGDDQFDFLWKNANGAHATQVKSTENVFSKADVEAWAKKLEKAHTDEICTLMLVGNIHPTLAKLKVIGSVSLKQKPLDLDGLLAEAGQRLAEFMEREGLPGGKATERGMIVHAIASKLLHLSTDATVLTRGAFVTLLSQWVRLAPKAGVSVDIERIVKYAPAELIGREAETQLLDDAWAQVLAGEPGRSRVLTFVAWGGEGKTSLVAKWAADLAARDWPGCDAVFAWSFYSQGTRERVSASADLFLAEALAFFGDAEMARSPKGTFEKGRRLARLVGERRALLLLDGLEPLQYVPTAPMPGELKDQGIASLLKGLAADSRGLCVVTTRYSLPDLRAFLGRTAREEKLARLSAPAGVAPLTYLGVRGSQTEYARLVEDVRGHALTLNLLGSYLRDAHGGDIRKRDLVKLEDADAEEQGGHAFRVMDAYVSGLETDDEKGRRALAILRLLGLFDRPVSADCLGALWRGESVSGLTEELVGLDEPARNLILRRLENAKLLTVLRSAGTGELLALDAHPLLREYLARRLQTERSAAWRAGHRRLYEHLCATTQEGDEPTLEALQPLYQAVAHGCQAGLYFEACASVYRMRIQKGNLAFSSQMLGASGENLQALRWFFEKPWSEIHPSFEAAAEAWILHEAAVSLRSLGRFRDALAVSIKSVDILTSQRRWKEASVRMDVISELHLILGDLDEALKSAVTATKYADISGDAFMRLATRTTQADALHQMGRRAAAKLLFEVAEQIQSSDRRSAPLLYSVQGFQYCELLIAAAEREAWRPKGLAADSEQRKIHAKSAHVVAERAGRALKIAVGAKAPLLTIALDHLMLGRVALYSSISKFSDLGLEAAMSEFECAVNGLRVAGYVDQLPLGLMSRAWQRCLSGALTGLESAQSDLDEAEEIAARGPMPLFQVDIRLYRARLFHAVKPYPWAGSSPRTDVAEARRLIEKHGYWRRKEELEDAEAALAAC